MCITLKKWQRLFQQTRGGDSCGNIESTSRNNARPRSNLLDSTRTPFGALLELSLSGRRSAAHGFGLWRVAQRPMTFGQKPLQGSIAMPFGQTIRRNFPSWDPSDEASARFLKRLARNGYVHWSTINFLSLGLLSPWTASYATLASSTSTCFHRLAQYFQDLMSKDGCITSANTTLR